MRRLFTYFLASSALISTACADSSVNILISSSAAAAGSTTQIQFFLAKPQTIAEGELNVDLDPAVFGDVTAVSAFSATGDAMGYAAIDGRHVDVAFRSPSGGIGKIGGNPIITVTVAILPGAVPGTRATVTADPSGSPWLDSARSKYSVSVTAGTVTISGALSVRSVQPGSGILPAGDADLRFRDAGQRDRAVPTGGPELRHCSGAI